MNWKTKPLLLLPLLAVLCWLCCTGATQSSGDVTSEALSRIVGGTQVSIAKRPYMVALLRFGIFHCGGTLITTRHVLTAAHCFFEQQPRYFVAIANTSDIRKRGVRRKFVRLFVPDRFNYDTRNFDVAVGKLRRRITNVSARPLPLCNHTLTVGDKLVVSGWGTTSETADATEARLRSVAVPVVRRRWCQRQYRQEGRITATMVCAGGDGAKDSCAGDSGGPAVHGGEICGIVSWGLGCGRRGLPGVFVNVQNPEIKQFIRRTMRK